MPDLPSAPALPHMHDPAHSPANAPTLDEPLLTADDVAALLAIPRSSVYEYARRSVAPLPAIRIGRHVRFLRSHIEDWLAELP